MTDNSTELTKEIAIEYWHKFLNSSRVKTNGYYVHGPYMYKLTLISFDRELVSIGIFLGKIYFQGKEFELSEEEKILLEDSYTNRNKNFQLKLTEIDDLLTS